MLLFEATVLLRQHLLITEATFNNNILLSAFYGIMISPWKPVLQVPPEELSFDYWRQVNAKGGDFKLSYGGIKKDAKYWMNPIRMFFRQG